MACVFRLHGPDLCVDDLLSHISLNPVSVYRKGQPRSNRPNAKLSETSGFNVVVSEAGFDNFETQIEEAVLWLDNNKSMLEKALAWPGVENATLDFGIHMRNVYFQSDSFPPHLVKLTGMLGIGLELSQYPPSRRPGKRLKNCRRLLNKRAFPKS